MRLYYVTETLTHSGEENACGIYSSLKKAQKAIFTRVAQEYEPEEMAQFKFTQDGTIYETVTNEWVNGCTYNIVIITLNAEMV